MAAQKGPGNPKRVPLAAWQVRRAIEREFGGLISMTDPAALRDSNGQMFRTRAAAALVVRGLLGCDNATAGQSVTDGFQDEGIDAVATDGNSRLWLIQSKWSDFGDQSLSVTDINTLLVGLRKVQRREFDQLNERLQAKEKEIVRVLDNPHRTITLVLVVMGVQKLSVAAMRRLDEQLADYNRINRDRPIIGYRVFLLNDLRDILRDALQEQPISLTVKMKSWHRMSGHLEAYQGEVAVGSVAAWQEQHGNRLFEKNLRKPLGSTEVNLGMVNTLLQEPENFGALNNGITMLCESLVPNLFDPSDPESSVGLVVQGASIVNGAQTVSAVSEAVRRDALKTRVAHVSVKVIAVGNAPASFGVQITQASNKQNQVELRDFVALDSRQADIEDDFRLSLPQRYVVKRGEVPPQGAEGCTVDEAAKALACVHSEPDIVIRATADSDLLWEQGSLGAYSILFQRHPRSAFEIWNLVQIQRAIGVALSDSGERRRDRAASVADRGDLLIAYIVMKTLPLSGVASPDFDIEPQLAAVPAITSLALDWLVGHIDAEYGPNSSITNTFAIPQRLTRLVEMVTASVKDVDGPPQLPENYRRTRTRRPNATPTLVDASRIKDGTTIIYQPGTSGEQNALQTWLDDDPRRSQASWLNDRAKPLLWAIDGRQYSPTGLTYHLWDLAQWAEGRPQAAQGPARWLVPGEGTLADLAAEILDRQEDVD
ncbi:AIPR family protein [Micromonospora sp. H61]|uniref:AIPR family protein n=1 Tax=Micromonospora sp. H61 TaxID=2824888 RepID=UPI001B394B8A|nr:AIPR family protein [Micromonospora sp. H61]MBQ0994663.1 AIPR family protein [Micromonospora sp. H61]